jgi:hypothetical protein
MSSVTVERLVTELVFQGDIEAYDRATITVAGLSEAAFAAAAALAGLAATTAAEITQYARLGEGLGVGVQGARELSAVFIALGADTNDVSDALQTVSDYALEAATGNKEWVKTFKAAGVEISALKGKNPDEILEVVADGIQSLGSAAERAAAASRIFGDDVGRKLLPLLVQGSEGIKRMREEARIFGGVITDEAAKSAVELEGDLRRLRYASDALRMRFGIALMPTLRLLTHDILEWVQANKEWVALKLDKAADSLKHAFAALTGPIGGTVVAIGGLLASARAAQIAIKMLSLAVGTGEGGLALKLAPLVAPAGVLLLFVAAIEDLMYAAEGGPSVFADLADALGFGSEFRNALSETKGMLGDAAKFAAAFGDSFVEAIDKIYDKFPLLKKISEAMSWIDSNIGLLLVGGNLSDLPGVVAEDQAQRGKSARRGFQKATTALESGQFGFSDVLNSIQLMIDENISSVFRGGRRGQQVNIGGSSVTLDELYGLPGQNRVLTNVTINANGLSAAEAETVVRNVLDAEVRGANDAASQGTR